MDRMEDLQENILSIAIYDLFPSLEGNRVVNKLLDGTLHIQTIGEAMKYVSFRIVSDDANMNRINDIEFTGEPIKVFYDNKFYQGKIEDLSQWREELFGEIDTRLYAANIRLVVESEGIV